MSEQILSQLEQLSPILEPIFKQLRPLTKHIPKQVVELGRDLHTPAVFDRLILDLDPLNTANVALLQLFISKTLSLGILGFSSIVKLPQISNIIGQASANGLSFPSILLETLSYLITIGYNFRKGINFMNFGEVIFVALQNALILLLILYYTGKGRYINGTISIMCVAAFAMLGNTENPYVFDDNWVELFAKFAVPLTIIAKLPQIFNNFKKRSTGALSLASVGAGLMGTMVRLFTLVSTGITDNLILLGLIASVTLNLIVFAQILIFKPRVTKEKKTN